MLSHSPERLSSFRPFVPNLKAEARAKFLQENYKVGEEGVEVKKEQNKIEEQAQLSQEEKPVS